MNWAKLGLRMGDYGARETTQVVQRWIGDHPRAAGPCFVFINYMEPHARYGVTPSFARWLSRGVSPREALAVGQDLAPYVAGLRKVSQGEFEVLRSLYDGDMTYLDLHIGRLVQHLRRLDLLDDTLLILTSDHGEEFGEHGLVEHAFGLYNTLLHIPLIIRYPRSFEARGRVATAVQTLDLFPTILDTLGIEWEGRARLHGRSLLEKPEPRPVVAEKAIPVPWLSETIEQFPNWRGHKVIRRLKSIQDGGFKYIWASDGEEELYDLRRDPGEQKNRIGEMPDKARELRSVLGARLGGHARRELARQRDV